MPKIEFCNIQADWSKYENRCPWASVVSSRELSQVLGVSLQTINNWKMRNILPEPEPSSRNLPAGNRNYWRLDRIMSLIENRPIEEIHREWWRRYVEPYSGPIDNVEQADFYVRAAYTLLGVQKPLLTRNPATPS